MNYLKIMGTLFQFRRNLGKKREDIQTLQDKKLRKIIRYAYKNSPYYRKTFNEAGIDEGNIESRSLASFPSIDKSTFLERFEEIVTVPDLTQKDLRTFDENETMDNKVFKEHYHIIHSSGSTGKPGYFIYDRKAWETMLAGILRAAFWEISLFKGLRIVRERPRIAYIAATTGRYAGVMAAGDGIRGVGARQLSIDINTPLEEWVAEIKKFKPNVIIGYPSAIKILAKLLQNVDMKLNFIRIISCGEPLSPGLRDYFEKVFGTDVINIYGASESLALGVESDNSGELVLFDDMNVIEIEDGQMYLTSLYNFVQPLIRYKISDFFILENPGNKSDYPFKKAIGLIGRSEDVLWFEDEVGNREFLHPLAVEGFCIEGLKDYQFFQTKQDSFEMQAEISDEKLKSKIEKEIQKQMKEILAEKKLKYVGFEIRFVNKILPDPKTGKKALIIKKA